MYKIFSSQRPRDNLFCTFFHGINQFLIFDSRFDWKMHQLERDMVHCWRREGECGLYLTKKTCFCSFSASTKHLHSPACRWNCVNQDEPTLCIRILKCNFLLVCSPVIWSPTLSNFHPTFASTGVRRLYELQDVTHFPRRCFFGPNVWNKSFVQKILN